MRYEKIFSLWSSASKWCTQHSSWVAKRVQKPSGLASKTAKFAPKTTILMRFWSGVKSRAANRAKTSHVPSFLWRMFSTRSWEMLTSLAMWLIVNRLSPITVWWTRSITFGVVVVAGRPDLGSSSWLFRPFLRSAAHFCIVDKPGALSPKVSTMSARISLGVNFFLPVFCVNTMPDFIHIQKLSNHHDDKKFTDLTKSL